MITLRINGEELITSASPDTPLLYVLRNEFQLFAAKFGCGMGQCGSCAVLIDGEIRYSCLLPVAAIGTKSVRTVEGLSTMEGDLHPVQQAFMEENAAQCGYCTSGMMIATVALLEEIPQPEDEQIQAALKGQLCRCGSHPRVMKAVKRAIL
ncbi:MAG: (2Fe-2S)-binding protein [Saprospiraceae bacterium]|nr:(2Fe-2S)-binding protein [Saprospiraceae bacterium]